LLNVDSMIGFDIEKFFDTPYRSHPFQMYHGSIFVSSKCKYAACRSGIAYSVVGLKQSILNPNDVWCNSKSYPHPSVIVHIDNFATQ
jgi:hypothetical protein